MTSREFLGHFGNFVVSMVAWFLPTKKRIIFESNPDFSDNTGELYKKMLELGYNEKYEMVWMLNGKMPEFELPRNVRAVERALGSFFTRIVAKWTYSRARFIIDCNVFVPKLKKNQYRIHLKHGLPMKDASAYNNTIGKVDLISVPSEYWVARCSKEHSVDERFIKPLGFPRNDALVPVPHEQKSVIWMPTFRFTATDTDPAKIAAFSEFAPFGLPFVSDNDSLKKINELFKKYNAVLYIRFHPVQDASGFDISNFSNIKLCDNAFLAENKTTLYSFLSQTDALISDYSSIYYDYLLLDKPVALAAPDFDVYIKYYGLLADTPEKFEADFPAHRIKSFEELLEFSEAIAKGEDVAAEKRKAAKEKYMPASSVNSSQRIIDYMVKNFNF